MTGCPVKDLSSDELTRGEFGRGADLAQFRQRGCLQRLPDRGCCPAMILSAHPYAGPRSDRLLLRGAHRPILVLAAVGGSGQWRQSQLGLIHDYEVPWSPTYPDVSDARLDPYRDRLAGLYRGGALAGHVIVLTESWAQLAGHLWWRRWELGRELAQPRVQLLDGSHFDVPIQEANFEQELEHWSRGKFPVTGELLDLVWLSQEEAVRLAPEIFGLSYCLDNDDKVVWSKPEIAETA
jgi:hypothetical protein